MAAGDTFLTAQQSSLENAVATSQDSNTPPDGWDAFRTPDIFVDGTGNDTAFINATNGTDYVRLREIGSNTYEEGIQADLTGVLQAGVLYELTIDAASFSSSGTPLASEANSGTLALSRTNSLSGELAEINVVSTPTDAGLNTYTVQFTPTANISNIFLVNKEDSSDSGIDDTLFIDNVQITEVCFTRGTMIDTDAGEVAVQDLSEGMMVRTRDNGFQPIRWIGMSPTRDRAVRIKAGALGNTRDLTVSPRHRMMLDGWQLEMLFDHDHALVTALELVNDDTIVRDEMADVEYYHVMFDKHEVIYAEGAATESFHPDQPSMGSMDAAAREEIFALFPELRDGAKREEAAANLSPVQAAYVGKNLDAFVG